MLFRRGFLSVAIGVVALLNIGAQPASRLSVAEKEEFLRSADVVRKKATSVGVTGVSRATLSGGAYTHDASIQTIDEFKSQFQTNMGTEFNFRDSWKYNVAAYKLDRMLGLNMVPVTVERKYSGSSGSFCWWVDDVLMMELDRARKKITPPDLRSWNDQMYIVRVFDQLIYNTDRNLGNLIIDRNWNIWMIDHTRAFRLSKDPREMKNLVRCDRQLLEKMKQMIEEELLAAMKDLLTKEEIGALLSRRDKIVAYFENAGPDSLYDAPRRSE